MSHVATNYEKRKYQFSASGMRKSDGGLMRQMKASQDDLPTLFSPCHAGKTNPKIIIINRECANARMRECANARMRECAYARHARASYALPCARTTVAGRASELKRLSKEKKRGACSAATLRPTSPSSRDVH